MMLGRVSRTEKRVEGSMCLMLRKDIVRDDFAVDTVKFRLNAMKIWSEMARSDEEQLKGERPEQHTRSSI